MKKFFLIRLNLNMKITILNIPQHNTLSYLESLLDGLKSHKRFQDANITVISEAINENLKDFCHLDSLPINFIPQLPSNPKFIDEYVSGSDIAFVMCNTTDNDPDGYTFDIVNRLSEMERKPKYIVAECMHDSERTRILQEGANAIIRPTRTYPSIFIRSIASLGCEEILENLIDFDSKYTTLEINDEMIWKDVYFQYYSEYGAAIGYYDRNNTTHLNPKFSDLCDIHKIFFMNR